MRQAGALCGPISLAQMRVQALALHYRAAKAIGSSTYSGTPPAGSASPRPVSIAKVGGASLWAGATPWKKP